MLKFIHPADEKLMVLDGLVPRFIGKIRRQLPYSEDPLDPVSYQHDDWIYWRGVNHQGPDHSFDDHTESLGRFLWGRNAGIGGKFLNDSSVCKLGRYAYTHFATEYYASDNPAYPSLIEWDIHNRNVTKESGMLNTGYGKGWISQGGRDIFGKGWAQDLFGWFMWDPGLIEYNGNLVMVAVGEEAYGANGVLNRSDKRFCKFNGINPATNLYDTFFTFMYCPNIGNGSGIGVFNGFDGSGAIPIETKNATMEWSDELSMEGVTSIILNVTSTVNYQNEIYAATPAYAFRCQPSGDFGRIIYKTDSPYFMPSPKWFEKHNGNLYMLEGSGTLSQIIPDGDNTNISGIYDFSYIEPYNLKWGSLYMGEKGCVRATKSDICSYKDKLHVFLQIGSGTYYFCSSGNLDSWVDRTEELPSIFNNQQGNIYSYHDNMSDKLYVFYNTMSKQGLAGVRNWGDEETGNIFHMYLYNDSSWEFKGWFTDSTRQSNGGFVPFNDHGPHVEMPSGTFGYPRDFSENNEIDASGNIVNISPFRDLTFRTRSSLVVDKNMEDGGNFIDTDGEIIYANINMSFNTYGIAKGDYPYDELVEKDSVLIGAENYESVNAIVRDNDNYCYLATHNSGVATFYVDSSGNIEAISGSGNDEPRYRDIEIDDDYIYGAHDFDGIKVFTYNSGVIHYKSETDLGGDTFGIKKHGDILYELNIENGIRSYSISTSGTLDNIDIAGSGKNGSKFDIYGDYLYLSYYGTDDTNRKLALIQTDQSGNMDVVANIEDELGDECNYGPEDKSLAFIKHDDNFLYVGYLNDLFMYNIDASGHLDYKWKLQRYYSSTEDGRGYLKDFVFPSGAFDARANSQIYTILKGNQFGAHAGVVLSDLHYEFTPKSEATVTPYFFVCKDFAVIDYKLYHEDSASVNVEIEYSLDDGCSWDTCERKKDYATQQLLGESITNLSASPSGEWHTFYWDFIRTLGYNVNADYCKIRITPFYNG